MNSAPLKRKLELIWWCFTAIVVTAVLLPILLHTHGYPFYFANALYVVIFITFTRYAFFLKHTWLAHSTWIKLLVLAGGVITVFLLLMSLGDFSTYLEDQGLQTLVNHLPVKEQYSVMRYIQGEMIFFGIASAVSAVLLPLRMLISVYRAYNHGTV